MPALQNPKHEQFCHSLLEKPSATQAYLDTYKSEYSTARTNSSELLAKTDIRNRFLELLNQQKAGLSRVAERLRDHLESETESISLDTCKTILKVSGVFDEADQKNMQNIQVSIVRISANVADKQT